jgi:hypothetical protein
VGLPQRHDAARMIREAPRVRRGVMRDDSYTLLFRSEIAETPASVTAIRRRSVAIARWCAPTSRSAEKLGTARDRESLSREVLLFQWCLLSSRVLRCPAIQDAFSAPASSACMMKSFSCTSRKASAMRELQPQRIFTYPETHSVRRVRPSASGISDEFETRS